MRAGLREAGCEGDDFDGSCCHGCGGERGVAWVTVLAAHVAAAVLVISEAVRVGGRVGFAGAHALATELATLIKRFVWCLGAASFILCGSFLPQIIIVR